MDLKLARKVWDSAARPTCLDCGKVILHIKNREVYGWGVQCRACMVKRLDGPATPHQEWSKGLNLRRA